MSIINPLTPATFYEQPTSITDLAEQTAHTLAGLAARNPTAELPHDQRTFQTPVARPLEGADIESGPSPEAIRQLETLPLLAERKVSLLLTSLGDKPMGVAGVASPAWFQGEPEPPIDTEVTESVVTVAHHLGLNAHILERVSSGVNDGRVMHQRFQLVTASHSNTLLEMADTAFEQKSNEDKWILGQAFGYPPSAVEAYVHERGISPRTITNDPELIAFAQFKLSPEHSQQELEVARGWASRVREISPAIYQMMLADSSPMPQK